MRSLTLGAPLALVTALVIGPLACDDVETGQPDSSDPLPVPNGLNEGGGGSSNQGGGGNGTGGSVPASCDGPGPAIETAGVATRILLKGIVLAPAGAMAGEVLIENDTITCVAASCSAEPGAAGATVIQTHGIISPGLIDGHNHI